VVWIEEKAIKAPWKKDKKPGAGACSAMQSHHHDLDGRPVSAQVGDMWLKKSGIQQPQICCFYAKKLQTPQSDFLRYFWCGLIELRFLMIERAKSIRFAWRCGGGVFTLEWN